MPLSPFKSLADTPLFEPLKIGNVTLQHRAAMAPLTRFRANDPHVHEQPAVEYYGQRASPGGLLVTEATFISLAAGGYPNVPGIWNDDQVKAWKQVTDAVHAKGGFIFCQLWALGRTALTKVLKAEGSELVSSSATAIEDHDTARPLSVSEIKQYAQTYATAAKNAIKAGFDGVEIHNANGYLLDQFVKDVANHRTDQYGGSIENRSRFTLEVVEAVTAAVGQKNVAIRFSPWSHFQGMKVADPVPQFSYLVEQLASKYSDLAYLSIVEPRTDGPEAPERVEDTHESNDFIYKLWSPRPVVVAGSFSTDEAKLRETISTVDSAVIAFGRAFISNPDLPERLKDGISLTQYDRKTFYGKGPRFTKGYVDYPTHKAYVSPRRGEAQL